MCSKPRTFGAARKSLVVTLPEPLFLCGASHTFDAKFTFVAIRVCLGVKTKLQKSVTLTNTVILNGFLILIVTFYFW